MSSGGSSKRLDEDAAAVLDYWFGDCDDPENVKRRGKLWFASTPEQDWDIRDRFGTLHERAQRGELDDWAAAPRTALALIVLLDQFTRNLYRRTSLAFANDDRALGIARDTVEQGLDRTLHPVERAFLYLPFQHSENPSDQARSVQLYQSLLEDSPPSLKSFTDESYRHALLHRDLVERFGRFPHRNALLGRSSTQAERDYLDQGGQSFGQG